MSQVRGREGWSGRLLVADYEDVQESEAVEIERGRLRPISTSANFDLGQFRLRPIFGY